MGEVAARFLCRYIHPRALAPNGAGLCALGHVCARGVAGVQSGGRGGAVRGGGPAGTARGVRRGVPGGAGALGRGGAL